jgi:carboxyl-terminal processing protease
VQSITRSVAFRLATFVGFGVVVYFIAFWALERLNQPPSAEAEQYLMHGVAEVRAHHINSEKMDWPKVTAEAHRRIRGASGPSDTYAALRWLFREAGEQHSFFLTPAEVRSIGKPSFFGGSAPERPSAERIGKVGMVRLPALGSPPAEMQETGADYTRKLHSLLIQLDRLPLCGWIVDLRSNGGGNMWPMLGGLGPLLGAPPFGYFVDRNGKVTPWDFLEGTPQLSLRQADLPVAVLIDSRTASSGEMAALSLIGRPNVRTFGEATAGLTTGNVMRPMPDGALLVVTSTYARDRTGKDYQGSIEPDVAVEKSTAQKSALLWLEESCPAAA